MTKGVIYYHRGKSCIPRLCVSISSLRKHYGGNVCVIQEGPMEDWLRNFLKDFDVQIKDVPEQDIPTLVRKSLVWKDSPYDITMYLDVDTIVMETVDEFIQRIEEYPFVATWFSGWQTTGGSMQKRIKDWNKVNPDFIQPALDYGKAINTGIMGWQKNASILPAYSSLTKLGNEKKCGRLVLDEIAMQLLLPHHDHYTEDHIWNTSGKFGNIDNAKIIHYHGRKHCQDRKHCDPWKDEYWEIRNTNKYGNELNKNFGDKRLNKYLDEVCKKNVTVVSAANKSHIGKLEKNIENWMKTPGLREQNYLIFVNGLKSRKDRSFLDKYNRVSVKRWDNEKAETPKELMLSCFIFGAAKFVKTEYMMKLDADCGVKHDENGKIIPFTWPEYDKFAITSHKWGFTKVKGDPIAKKHWLNTLDDWFGGEPHFKEQFDLTERVKSSRIQSFCSIDKMDFIKRLSDKCDGKLPIPSQDTTTWYVAMRWNEPINRINMKNMLRHK